MTVILLRTTVLLLLTIVACNIPTVKCTSDVTLPLPADLKTWYENSILTKYTISKLTTPPASSSAGVSKDGSVSVDGEGTLQNLNLSPTYSDYKAVATFELLQNFVDGSSVLARKILKQTTGAPSITTITFPGNKQGSPSGFALTNGNYLLGVLFVLPRMDEVKKKKVLDIEIINFDTILKTDIMILGHSSKTLDADLAGAFGEGVKVEINRHLAEGATSIRYRTGYEKWTFEYAKAYAGSDVRSLHLRSVPVPELSSATVTTIIGTAATCFDPLNFLFLQRNQTHSFLREGYI